VLEENSISKLKVEGRNRLKIGILCSNSIHYKKKIAKVSTDVIFGILLIT
jgi:hypothetical protein